MILCPFCHFQNEDGALFCEQCKSDLSGVPETVPAAQPAHAAPLTPDPVVAEPVVAEPVHATPMTIEPVAVPLIEPEAVPAEPYPLAAEPVEAMPLMEATPVEAVPAEPLEAEPLEAAPVEPWTPAVHMAETQPPPPIAPPIVPLPPPVYEAPPAPPKVEAPPPPPPPAPPKVEAPPPKVEAPAPAPPPVEAGALREGASPRLLVLRGQRRNVEYPIYEGLNFIGRADEKPVDIDLEDQEPPERIWCSRQHALVSFEENRLFLEDLNSANGTYLNRNRVYPGQKQPLKVNDIIQIGNVQLKVIV